MERIGYSVADLCLTDLFYPCYHKTHLTGREFCFLNRMRSKYADLIHIKNLSGRNKLDLYPFFYNPVKDPYQDNNAQICIIPAVKKERLQRLINISLRRGYPLHNRLKDILYAYPLFCAGKYSISCRYACNIFYLFLYPVRFSSRQVYLIYYRKNLQPHIHGSIKMREGLRLNTLGCIHHKYCAFACRKASGDLIAEIHMSWCIYKIQYIFPAVLRLVNKPCCLGLNSNTPLPFQFHLIKKLVFLLPHGYCTGKFQQSVRQR